MFLKNFTLFFITFFIFTEGCNALERKYLNIALDGIDATISFSDIEGNYLIKTARSCIIEKEKKTDNIILNGTKCSNALPKIDIVVSKKVYDININVDVGSITVKSIPSDLNIKELSAMTRIGVIKKPYRISHKNIHLGEEVKIINDNGERKVSIKVGVGDIDIPPSNFTSQYE